MSLKLYLFLVTCIVIVGVASADIFGDFFKWDLMSVFSDEDEDQDDDEPLQREEEDSSLQNTCNCEGMKCDCCVDFNITSIIDLGGPGCVNMKYISKEEGVLVNVSYGESVLHSQKITIQNKKGTCMSLLAYVAEICARFSNLQETEDGMTGCLNFEPTVFGEVTGQYPIGCFRMEPERMYLDNSLEKLTDEKLKEDQTEKEEEAEEETTTKGSEGEETVSFMEAVNQSAQESLEYISSLLGFNLNGKKQNKGSTTTTPIPDTQENSRKKKNTQSRKKLI